MRSELLARIVDEAKATDPTTGVDATCLCLTDDEKWELISRGCNLATKKGQRGTLVVLYPQEARVDDLRRKVHAKRKARD